MNGKQKAIRWMKYHTGSTIVLALFVFVACLGGFDMQPALLILSFAIAAVLLFSIEYLFWKAVIWIMGARFVANLLNDPWIIIK